ncbi:MAG TPA: VOC family protein [Hyphomonadaceae bacterium]|nr:VOC family protein [Hyphomonadaceae bacterium]HPN05034.1 VOC family protein [Hyphomonadaceae bacterium]
MTNPNRRQGVLGVHSLDQFSLDVPDIADARRFFEEFGLEVRTRAGGLELLAFEDPHVWAELNPATQKRLSRITFGAFSDDMAAFRGRLAQLGIPFLETHGPEALLFDDPHGVRLEVRSATKTSPDGRVEPAAATPRGLRGAVMRDQVSRVRPRRLSHALFFTPDIDATIQFYCDVLGLRVSDHPGPVVFLHGVHGSDHHLIAFAQSGAAGYHHSAWEVGSIEEVGLGAFQMSQAGYTRGWGVGRHVLGSNYFHYVRDPWGSFAEYSFDIDFIPADVDWEAGRPSPENSFFLWGPLPPEDFVANE